MVTPAVLAFLGSVFAFIVIFFTVRKERRQSRRFFAVRLRSWLDKKVDTAGLWLARSLNHFIKYIVQLNWYYSIHSVLRTILRVIIAAYTYMENIFENNRSKTKQLRAEKRQLNESNHLQQMATHKEDTALTAVQQQKLRKKNLEGK
jgi:hypothetical protein